MSQKSTSGNVDPVMWSDVASRILMNAVCHPIEYAKVLIQVNIHLLIINNQCY